jgi:RNA polymerase sigma-70 factor (ECF subfamily)
VERAGTAATLAKAGADDATRLDDASLVVALRGGDEAAFVELVEQYHRSLLRLARLYVADAAAAEDVVQETWLGLLRGLDRFEGRASLKTWLFRILVNRARTRAVRDARAIPFSSLVDQETEAVEFAVDPARFRPADGPRWPGHWLLPPAADELPETRLLASELTERVRAAVATLPPAQREVVALRDIEGWTADEVCRLLELSEANQRVLLHRGRSRVRAALEAYLVSARGLVTSA